MTTHVLLDIEGTTCSVSFVSEVLFPYASSQLDIFLRNNKNHPEINCILDEAMQEWHQDREPKSKALLKAALKSKQGPKKEISTYLLHLISTDRKSTALKDLQGRIWNEGYKSGAIQSSLFPEIPETLKTIRAQGYHLATYSSGSIPAQRLLYKHSQYGDLSALFNYWFDTRSGSKKESSSYRNICTAMSTSPKEVLFVSDSKAECDAASAADLQAIFSLRKGNPEQDPGQHLSIGRLDELLRHLNESCPA